MLYRNHREYSRPPSDAELGLLRNWLRGEAGVENLREWLSIMYN